MENTILISWDELQQQIDLKNFYMGESAKRKDIDADTIQSSIDDKELLRVFAQSACNQLITAVAVRFPTISCNVKEEYIELVYETESAARNHIRPMLRQAIIDYVVNEVIMQWLLLRQPSMAQTCISLRLSLYNNVQYLFAKIYNTKKTRRRATDLAGI